MRRVTAGRFLALVAIAVLAWAADVVVARRQAPVVAAGQQGRPPASGTEPRPGSATLVGRVVDVVTRQGLGGATVELTCGSTNRAVVTEDNGGFAFLFVPAGSCVVRGARAGYSGSMERARPDGAAQFIDIRERMVKADLIVGLAKLGSVTGTVTDEAGLPIVGMPIRVFERRAAGGRLGWNPVYAFQPRPTDTTATTDDRGMYRVGNLPPGQYIVGAIVTLTTLPESIVDRYFSGPIPPPDLRTAVASVSAAITPPGTSQSLRVGKVVIQSTGLAPLPHPTEDGRLVAFASTFLPALGPGRDSSALILGPGEDRIGADLIVPATTTVGVSGRLLTPEGTPASLVPLRLLATAAGFPSGGFDAAATLTDAEGRFTFLGVTPGAYKMHVRVQDTTVWPAPPSSSLLWADESLEVGNQDVTTSIALQAGIRFRGSVEFEGTSPKPTAAAINGIRIGVMSAEDSGASRMAEDGSFVSSAVPAGNYTLSVSAAPAGWSLLAILAGGRDLSTSSIDVGGGDVLGVRVVFTDRPAIVSGRANGAQGVGNAGALAVLFPADERRWTERAAYARAVRADHSGNFQFVAVPPGDYLVAALLDSGDDRWRDPAVFQQLSRVADRVAVRPGGRHTVVIRMVTLR